LRTSTRIDIRAWPTFRVNPHTGARTRFVVAYQPPDNRESIVPFDLANGRNVFQLQVDLTSVE